MITRTNSLSQMVNRLYENNKSHLDSNLKKLSSGQRINSAKDDAAGLAISSKMFSHLLGYKQAINNTQEGISLVQTAEGALENVQELLKRGHSLCIQAANQTLTSEDRAMIQTEISQISDEINRIGNSVTYNGLSLLTGYIEWYERQIDTSKTTVLDVGIVGSPEYGIYKVKLDTAAKAQEQTSAVKTGSFKENEALSTASDTITNPTVAGGKYTYSGGNWIADFAGTNIELMNSMTADGTSLTEGVDYTYTNGVNGADEANNKVNIKLTGNTTQTITNENAASTGINNQIKVTDVITNWNIGDTKTINDALVGAATTGVQNVSNAGISYTLDQETYNDQTGSDNFTVGNIAGSTQIIDIAGKNTNMQVTKAALNSFNVTALTDTSAQMTGFTAANNGFTGAQADDTVASDLTSTVNVARKVTVGQTIGTFTADSLSVGAVTVTDATIQDEEVSSDGIIDTDGATYDVHQFTVSGSNISAVKVSNIAGAGITDSVNNILQFYAAGGVDAVKAGGIGDYYYDSSTGVFTVKVNYAFDINTSKVTYTADYQWSADETLENADNTFSLTAKSTAKNGTTVFTGDETVTYNANITYRDDEYESITVDNTGAIDGTNFTATGNNKAYVYGAGGDFRNSDGVLTNNTFEWIGAGAGFATDTSIDYIYGIDYTKPGFNITKTFSDGTVSITKTSGNTTSQFLDTDESQKISYNYKDMYVDNFQITNPGNVNNSANWGVSLVSVKGTDATDITGSSSLTNDTGAISISGVEQYVGDLAVEYKYKGDWTVSALSRDSGVFTFNAPAGSIAPRIDQLIGQSTVQMTYNTFKDNIKADWAQIQNEAVLNTTQYTTGGDGTANFITPYTRADQGSVDTGTPTSLWLRDSGSATPNSWLTFGTSAQVAAGTADYTIEGKSLRFKSGINSANVKAYYVTSSNGNAIDLNAADVLGNTQGNADATKYTTANQGIFKGFYQTDKISFTVDGRQIDINVNPSDTVQDLIDRINTTSNEIFLNSGTKPENAYMDSGTNNNAGIWAKLVGNQIVISSRDETNNYGYKGTRFNITVNDSQIGPGTFLNFAVSTASQNSQITITDPNGTLYTSSSTDNSNFFNNTTEVSGIPGVRIQLKEDLTTADIGNESEIELLSLTIQDGPDVQSNPGINLIDMRSGAIGISSVNVSTISSAQQGIDSYASAINKVSSQRAYFGAISNKFNERINFLGISSETTAESKSRIMDTDYAEETINLVKSQLLDNSASIALNKANELYGNLLFIINANKML